MRNANQTGPQNRARSDRDKPWGGDLYSWLWVIGMLMVGLGVSGAALASVEFRKELGADWGTVLLLVGAGALLIAINENAGESRTRLVEWAVSTAGLFGFAGAFIILSFENSLVLVAAVAFLMCYFVTSVPVVSFARFCFGVFTRRYRRRTRNRNGNGTGDVTCLWCYDKAAPDDGLCGACWRWVQSGETRY